MNEHPAFPGRPRTAASLPRENVGLGRGAVVGYWEKLDEVEAEQERGRGGVDLLWWGLATLVGVVTYIAVIHAAWLMLAG